jgi:glyoxylase-like metal-dependent hydrolase (beta-lactamase superfamily II)
MRLFVTAALVALAISGCSKPAGAGAQTDAARATKASASAPEIKLYALDCGRFDISDMGSFDIGGAYDGKPYKLSDGCFLIRHPDGDLLWDSGLPDALHALPEGQVAGGSRMTAPLTLKSQLASIGVQPGDIEYLSLSHSHGDHAGNANDYAGSTFLVQKKERAYMFRDEARADSESFNRYSALENARTVELDGDYDVFKDDSVTIVSTPGHTPGHSSLLVKLKKSGPVFLTGDLYHLAEARQRRTVPNWNTDPEETWRSMDTFEALAKESGARVVIQHEPSDFDALPKPPEFLD